MYESDTEKKYFRFSVYLPSNLNANLRRFNKLLFAVNLSRTLEFAICKASIDIFALC